MRGSNKRRIRSEIIAKVHSDEDEDVGTAARTRPLSYDEIMLKRKNRKVEYGDDGDAEVGKVSSKEATRYESGQSALSDVHIKPNDARASYSRKEEKASKRGSESAKSKNKDHQELEAKSSQKMEKQMHHKPIEKIVRDVRHRSSDKMEKAVHHRSLEGLDKDTHHISGEKLEKDVHRRLGEKSDQDFHGRSRGKLDKAVHHRSGEKSEKDRSGEKLEKLMHHRSSAKVEKVAHHQSNEKREKDTSYRASQRTGRDTSRRSKQNSEKELGYKSLTVERDNDRTIVHERIRDNSEYDNQKKNHRDHLTSKNRNIDRDAATEREYKRKDWSGDHLTSKNRNIDRDAATEREYKRKDWSGDDVQHVDKHVVKKHDSGKRLVSERKENIDSSLSHHEEARLKRRRSKSPEHTKDRARRSGSFSPRARKFSSSRGEELHLDKDRSKHQIDAERSKTSNGSGSGGLYHRHGGSSSGLGGYSPRKRKTNAAVRTPSPLKRSPEKKSAGWDRNLSGTSSTPTSLAPSAPQLLVQAKPLISAESAGAILANLNASNSLPNLPSSIKNALIDSVQLTQATRPLRRLYVDNVPSSASEKDIMECFNNFLLVSGANRIQGSKPCISCMIHKEKGQALVEFLTPEDASAALGFDGRSFSGSSLKIRRPKDFVELANDFPERSKAGADAVSDIVKDSPHKIFVGGISNSLSYEMLLEILHAFGPLKAFHFEMNEKNRERCAFLEFVDQSVTLKACAALNGMKLGGKLLTVAQAFPDASFVETHEDVPCYEIPHHVKTLLEKPTEILKIKNAVNPLAIGLLSESDLEEILEDVRHECTRFGSVKSINIVKTVVAAVTAVPETQEATNLSTSYQISKETADSDKTLKTELDVGPDVDSRTIEMESTCNIDDKAENERKPKEERQEDDLVSDPTTTMEETVIEELRKSDSTTEPINNEDNKFTTEDPVAESPKNEEGTTSIPGDVSKRNGDLKEKEFLPDNVPGSEVDAKEVSEMDEKVNADHIFEPGCIFVEFRRTEASCLAAHCLHGRLFDGRTVTIEYVPHNLYKKRFPK